MNVENSIILSQSIKKVDGGFSVPCFRCGNDRTLKTIENVRRAIKYKRTCNSCSRRNYYNGKNRKRSEKCKSSMSITHKNRYSDINERIKTSESVKLAMNRPEVRKKHLAALHHSQWIKVRTDKGQLEILEKWNRLGFNFEPNYQVITDSELFYVDGYDSVRNIVFEYDSKYHSKLNQKQKDLIRQNKILDILKPKKFWRYNFENKSIENVSRFQ